MREAAALAELERQNAVLNRFEELLCDFAAAERLTRSEALDTLLTSAAHNIGHAAVGDDKLNDIVRQFVRAVRIKRAEHKRDCVGKAH